MNKSDVTEIKKRYKKDKVSFSKVVGCYVNSKKEIVCKFSKQFLNLPEEDFFKFLEISNKLLSGTMGNNLINYEFPLNEEKEDGKQTFLYKLKESKLEDETLLDKFYQNIINCYKQECKYLIVLFFDEYDVPIKTTDNRKIDESEEIYQYFLCGICPVELSKPTLGYLDDSNNIGAVCRDWVVLPPETGFTYPTFTERTTDIHSALFYTKNAKEPHNEFIDGMFGCEPVLTTVEQKTQFEDIIKNNMAGEEDDVIKDTIIDIQYNLKLLADTHKQKYGEKGTLMMSKTVIDDALEDVQIDNKEQVSKLLEEVVNEQDISAEKLIDSSSLKIGEIRSEKKTVASLLADKIKENEILKGNVKNNKVTIISDKQVEKRIIDGVEYILIPSNDANIKSI